MHAVDTMCASIMHELAWPHCLRLDTFRFYDFMKYAFMQQKAVSINAIALPPQMSECSKSAQSTAAYTIVAGVFLFLHWAYSSG